MNDVWVFDVEADNFLESATVLHCIVAKCVATEELKVFHDAHPRYAGIDKSGTIAEGVEWLQDKDLVGHNILDYDVPLIARLHGKTVGRRHTDTVLFSRLLFPDMYLADSIAERAMSKVRKQWVPKNMFGKHSLASWGYRLDDPKIDYVTWCNDNFIEEPFAELRPEMLTYCLQDVCLNVTLYKYLEDKAKSWGVDRSCLDLEQDVQRIIRRQVAYGVMMDVKKVEDLYRELSGKRAQVTRELQDHFGSFYVYNGRVVPKRSLHYKDILRPDLTAGAPYTKVKRVLFEPGSRHHVANRLKNVYGWRPKDFTPKGEVKVDEDVLSRLTYPPAKQLADYYMLDKRCSQIADGKNAWMAFMQYSDDNTVAIIKGEVITLGAVTSRMAHTRPNLGQVPASRNPYGTECRACFVARPGKVWVGCDADSLEFRGLSHYALPFGGDKMRNAVIAGEKAKKTDVHSLNMFALGHQDYPKGRDTAKTWIYALLYGAGDYKLGLILNEGLPDDMKVRTKTGVAAMGRESRERVKRRLPGLIQLVEAAKKAAKRRGWIRGLDGRRVPIRSAHSVLSTLFQSFGAIVMKRALVIADETLQSLALEPGVDYEFVLNIHDEWQVETTDAHTKEIGQALVQAIEKAGEYYNTLCPLTGDYKVGHSWADTH